MKLGIAEIFESMQGEGSQGGMPSLFIRLAGCNLWSGREEGRAKGSGNCALWCDTNFLLQYKMEIEDLREQIKEYASRCSKPLITFTGGEPTLWANKIYDLCKDLLDEGIMVAIETNGTRSCELVDLLYSHELGNLVLSPKRDKAGSFDHIQVRKCNDLKLVYPDNAEIDIQIAYDVLYLQPIDDKGDMGKGVIDNCIEYACKIGARISVQQHKLLDLR